MKLVKVIESIGYIFIFIGLLGLTKDMFFLGHCYKENMHVLNGSCMINVRKDIWINEKYLRG